jgi:hypothetical protein
MFASDTFGIMKSMAKVSLGIKRGKNGAKLNISICFNRG